MARPKTKAELIQQAQDQFEKMWTLIDTMTDAQKARPFSFGNNPSEKEAHWKRDKNLRDVCIHLYEWHQLLLMWITRNLEGEMTPFLPEPYNWKTYGDMNVKLWEKHQATVYDEAKRMLMESHKQVLSLIEPLSNEALFEKAHFTWTGTTSVGSYCVSATCSHYEWAIKKIKKHIKN